MYTSIASAKENTIGPKIRIVFNGEYFHIRVSLFFNLSNG
jgi:hypothetical protein